MDGSMKCNKKSSPQLKDTAEDDKKVLSRVEKKTKGKSNLASIQITP
jgi:hypothetical protein